MERKEKLKSIVIILSIVCFIFLTLFVVFCCLYGFQNSTTIGYENNLNYIYTKNFYEVVDNVNNIETKLNKLEVSNSTVYQQKLLTEISENAKFVQANLNELPFSQNSLTKTLTFINEISGYTETVSKSLNDELYTLTEKEQQTLSELKVSMEDVKKEFDEITREIINGKSIVKNTKLNNDDLNNFTKDFESINKPLVDYPSMTYDGPFSDSILNREIKGLTGEGITSDEAKAVVEKIYSDATSIAHTGEADGKFETFNFMVIYPNKEYYVQITKKGGHLLTISSGNTAEAKNKTIDECKQIAEEFLKNLGYENMKVNWSEENENFVYFNLAPVINEIIYYPDLIKVKVNMEDGAIEGVETTTYYYNHIERTLPTITVSETTAKASISDLLTVEKINKALVPKEFLEEVLCYEIITSYNNIKYYVYINCTTGKEEQILKEVETDYGMVLV